MRVAALLIISLLIVTSVFAGSPTQSNAVETASFEVASIRQSPFPNDAYFAGFASAGICNVPRTETTGNRIAYLRATLCGLIRVAYDVRDYQIVNMPAWMTKPEPSIFYDIETRTANGATLSPEHARRMLQALLADRFQLRTRRESRELPVYALVVGSKGPAFKEGGPSPCPDKPKGTMLMGPGLFASCGPTTSMAHLAQTLSHETDRVVVDRTGLAGNFAFRLEWTRDNTPVRADSAPSIYTAVQEQLGLRLEPQRLPVEAVVVDRAERPSPN